MAKLAHRSSSSAISHRPNPLKGKLVKAHERLAALSKRGRAVMADQELSAISIGAPIALGFAERSGLALPTVMQLDPAILYGGAIALLGFKVKGKNGKRMIAAGVGLLASGGRDSVKRGGVRVGEDEIAGDEEVGGIDDFDPNS
jgi:hypothetical protein